MTVGPSVKIPCVVDATGTAGEFKFPAEWGGSSMQCRDPVPCLADFPVPPYHSGLVVSDIYIVSASQYVSCIFQFHRQYNLGEHPGRHRHKGVEFSQLQLHRPQQAGLS